MKKMDNFKKNVKNNYQYNKKYIFFIVILALTGIIAGSVFTCYISNNDQIIVKNYIETFIKSIQTNNLNYLDCLKNTLLSNIIFIIIIWILGISIIGIPFNIIVFFIKSFILGFSISSFILKYKTTGIIYSAIYLFPHQIINFIIYIILMIYSLKFSIIMLHSIINKKEINLKPIINKYFKIIYISIICIVATSFFETYLTPFLFHKIFLFIS